MPVTEAVLVKEDEDNTRRCIVTGVRLSPDRLLRFVIDPSGQVVPDLENELPGRGFWLSASRDVVNTATKKGSFSKAARRQVVCPDDLADRVETLLLRRCLNLIGLARRAGQAVAGYEKVADMLRRGQAGLLIVAGDAGNGEGRKIRSLAAGRPVIDQFDSESMGATWGREKLVYIALEPGRLTERLVAHAERLALFRRTP